MCICRVIASLKYYFVFRLQKACGSLTNLLKIRGGADGDEPQLADGDSVSNVIPTDDEPSLDSDAQDAADGARSSQIQHLKKASTDINEKMSCQLGKLDSLLTKAEDAQYSMAQQNKQMKSFLK